jgi:hypothetical protein
MRGVGLVMGATLCSVLRFAGVDASKSCRRALRHLVRFLEPVVSAACRMRGERSVLLDGLACRNVLRQQRRRMRDAVLHAPGGGRTWLDRNGLQHVVMGATASVLVAHHIAAQEGADVYLIGDGLQSCCWRAEQALRQWNLSDSTHEEACTRALDAEVRALSRAQSAAEGAKRRAVAYGLGPAEALRLQLEAMRCAAWPAGERCDEEGHAQLCRRIEAGAPIGRRAQDGPFFHSAYPCTSVWSIPLSAIPASAWLHREGEDGEEEGGDVNSGNVDDDAYEQSSSCTRTGTRSSTSAAGSHFSFSSSSAQSSAASSTLSSAHSHENDDVEARTDASERLACVSPPDFFRFDFCALR